MATEAATTWKAEASSALTKNLADVTLKISEAVNLATDHSNQLLDHYKNRVSALTSPLAESVLITRYNVGTEDETRNKSTLAERMVDFREKLGRSMEKLQKCWARWMDAREQIEELGHGLRDAGKGVGGNVSNDPGKGVEGRVPKDPGKETEKFVPYAAEYHELEKEFQAGQDKILKKHKDDCEELQKEMEVSERVRCCDLLTIADNPFLGANICGLQFFANKQQEQNAHVQAYVKAQIDEVL